MANVNTCRGRCVFSWLSPDKKSYDWWNNYRGCSRHSDPIGAQELYVTPV